MQNYQITLKRHLTDICRLEEIVKKMKLTLVITKQEIKGQLQKFHYDHKDLDELLEISRDMMQSMECVAYYENIKELSKKGYLRTGESVMLSPDNACNSQFVAFVTLGKGIDILSEKYAKNEQVSREYMLECLAMMLLEMAYDKLIKRVCVEEHVHIENFHFWEDYYSLEQMKELVEGVKLKEISCTSQMMLNPSKSAILLLDGVVSKKITCDLKNKKYGMSEQCARCGKCK